MCRASLMLEHGDKPAAGTQLDGERVAGRKRDVLDLEVRRLVRVAQQRGLIAGALARPLAEEIG